ncbi:Uu.00g112900.m01.CDS01 [Anthostomella pinea]|uniref:phosphoadenylyl-sulfate reductase (thioredoxin) n=1 Tax=Anthostomella pinea TaxID=933095 RepID=A0AAI8VG25_9PEZI|nr:Uu.00g112900.m01.CDS01 [Anthostomella pinea]
MDTSLSSSNASSPRVRPAIDSSKVPHATDLESGYASASSSTASSSSGLPLVSLTKPHLRHLNQQMEKMTPMERLRFSMVLFPNLYQTTAFGLTGLVTIDMLSKIQAENPETSSPVDAIFLDTLYHFNETYDLVDRVRAKYPNIRLHVYRPDGAETAAQFEERYGERLYESAAELYDWVAKVEPQQRAYADLGVAAVFTGRRRSQGGERDKIGVIEVDEELGIVKINPLLDWSFAQVKNYITEHDVPYNVLLDRGYKSVGDWHSTSPVAAGEDERAGRWKGQAKTECGIHNKKSRYAQYLQDMQRKAEEEQLAAALGKVEWEQQSQPIDATSVHVETV